MPTCFIRCRLYYKAFGPGAELNFELPKDRRAQLDRMTLEQLVDSYRKAVKAKQHSQYTGVTWQAGKWRAQFSSMRDGKQVSHNGHYQTDEAAAARQADE